MVYHNLKTNISNLKILLFILCSIGIVALYSASSNIALVKFLDWASNRRWTLSSDKDENENGREGTQQSFNWHGSP